MSNARHPPERPPAAVQSGEGTITGTGFAALVEASDPQALLRFQARILQQLGDLVVICDLQGRVLYWNDGAARIFGYAAEELLGEHPDFLYPTKGDARWQEDLQEILGGGMRRTAWEGRRKDGRPVFLDVDAKLIRDDRDRPVALCAVAKDVTDRVRVEEQLRQAQKMEAVGRLAGGVAHDFNNVLTVISCHTALLLNELEPGSSLREDLEAIRGASDRAATLTRQLLAFSRKLVLQPVVLNLNAVLTELAEMLRRVLGEDIDLRLGLDPALGQVKVDRHELEHAIWQLAANSRDAMPRGGHMIIETANVELAGEHIHGSAESPSGPHVLLAVSDSGCGMDAATRARVFEPFYTTKGLGQGSGLGLASVYGIVKQSGGHISVFSEPGQGSTFKIYLPRVEEAAKVTSAPGVLGEVIPGWETVLLVEDEPLVRDLARRILRQYGYTVLEARTPQEALQLFSSYAPSIRLLVTDVLLPDLRGNELARRMTTLQPSLKVLYISGYADAGQSDPDIDPQNVRFLSKPFTPQALARKVRDTLDH